MPRRQCDRQWRHRRQRTAGRQRRRRRHRRWPAAAAPAAAAGCCSASRRERLIHLGGCALFLSRDHAKAAEPEALSNTLRTGFTYGLLSTLPDAELRAALPARKPRPGGNLDICQPICASTDANCDPRRRGRRHNVPRCMRQLEHRHPGSVPGPEQLRIGASPGAHTGAHARRRPESRRTDRVGVRQHHSGDPEERDRHRGLHALDGDQPGHASGPDRRHRGQLRHRAAH